MIFLPIFISKVTNWYSRPLKSTNQSILEALNNLTRVILVLTHLTAIFTQHLSITQLLAVLTPNCNELPISARLHIISLVISNKSNCKKPSNQQEVQIRIRKVIRIVFSLVNQKKIFPTSNLKMITNQTRNHILILNLSELSCSKK
jgi:hypothetical protein